MVKAKTVYVCSNCGADSPKWIGKCPSCGEWNTYVEEIVVKEPVGKRALYGVSDGGKVRPLQSVVRKRLVSMRPNPLAMLVSWQIGAGCVPDVNPLDFAGDFPRSPGSLSFLYSDLCS